MQFRKDQKTQKELSVLGYGCMRFPRNFGKIDLKKTEELILKAFNAGVNYYDTARIYPGSEEALGAVVAKNNLREKIFIATKLPVITCHNTSDFDKFFLESLKQLKTDYIDYYLMHMLTDIESWEKLKRLGIEEWIAQKKQSGAIKQIGFSFHGAQNQFLKILDAYPWEFCQIQYNYFDENYQAGKTGLKAASAKGIPVIIMEPLLGGKLVTGLPLAAKNAFKKANPDCSPAQWGLNWLWNQSEVSVVLSGMSDSGQLSDNLDCADKAHSGMLKDHDLTVFEQVKEAFNAAYKVHCTGCNYCMPCPCNVNIPGCFSAFNSSYAINRTEGSKQYVTSTAAFSATPHTASLCTECGKCENHCPQHIEIRKELKNVKKRLEPPFFRIIILIARLVFKQHRRK
ncbi:MAG: aldo/keto reductase [Termitinemataceae bacterium]|nr:MAG: aldo/keto reductase [Termitinemataceae bacterium]